MRRLCCQSSAVLKYMKSLGFCVNVQQCHLQINHMYIGIVGICPNLWQISWNSCCWMLCHCLSGLLWVGRFQERLPWDTGLQQQNFLVLRVAKWWTMNVRSLRVKPPSWDSGNHLCLVSILTRVTSTDEANALTNPKKVCSFFFWSAYCKWIVVAVGLWMIIGGWTPTWFLSPILPEIMAQKIILIYANDSIRNLG